MTDPSIEAAEARIQIRNNLNRIDRENMAVRQWETAQLEDEREIWARIGELARPYFDQTPPGSTLEQIRPMLTRAEAMELATLLEASPEEPGGPVPNGDTELIDVARHVAAGFASIENAPEPAVTATRLITGFTELYAQVETFTRDTRPPLTTEYTDIIDNQGRKVTVHLDEVVPELARALNAVMTALAEGAREHALALQAAFYGVGEDDGGQ